MEPKVATDCIYRTVHNFKEKNGRTLLSIEEFFEQEQILSSFTSGFGEANDEYVAIRTTTALVSCGGKVRQVVIAMDPCSNSTNIDEDLESCMVYPATSEKN